MSDGDPKSGPLACIGFDCSSAAVRALAVPSSMWGIVQHRLRPVCESHHTLDARACRSMENRTLA